MMCNLKKKNLNFLHLYIDRSVIWFSVTGWQQCISWDLLTIPFPASPAPLWSQGFILGQLNACCYLYTTERWLSSFHDYPQATARVSLLRGLRVGCGGGGSLCCWLLVFFNPPSQPLHGKWSNLWSWAQHARLPSLDFEYDIHCSLLSVLVKKMFWQKEEGLIKRITRIRTPPWSSNLKFIEGGTGEEGIKERDHGSSEESVHCCRLLIKA